MKVHLDCFLFSYALAWNPKVPGRLLSGSADGIVCLWDVNAKPEMDCGDRYIDALLKLDNHTDVIESVAWHHESNNLCCSVGDDKVRS